MPGLVYQAANNQTKPGGGDRQTGVADVLAKLQGPTWRDVPFPYVEMTNSLTQDHAEHKLPDVDGFHVEATGRNNLIISVNIPFRNGVVPAQSEKWAGRALYPDVFRAFVSAMADRTSGTLIHPEFGRINCKPRKCDWKYTANTRDGVDLTAEWTETTETGDDLNAIIAQPSAISGSIMVAVNLDAELAAAAKNSAAIRALNEKSSFGDLFATIQAIPDSATLYSQRLGGALHNVAAKIDRMNAAFVRFNHVRYWPIVQGFEHLKASVAAIQKAASVNPRRVIKEFLTERETTLAALATLLKNTVTDLINLNSQLAYRPIVKANKRVLYYSIVSGT